MKASFITLPFLLFLISLNFSLVQASIQPEYHIEIHNDGSATWIIEQRGTDISTSPQSFERFMNNVSLLVSLAREKTNRNMTCENFLMNVSISGSYKVVRYQFSWKGFAELKNTRIAAGDVFYVANFFSYLYGDGVVYLSYPSEYTVESVSPPSNKNATCKLEWYGILDFKAGEPKVLLREKNAPQNFTDIIGKNAALIVGVIALISGSLITLGYFKVRKAAKKGVLAPKFPLVPEMEDDEMKVISLLKAAGGSLYQSTISDRCRFSRSKTSKLLKMMEEKGKIKREEKGREKVVTLMEEKD